MPAMVIHFHQAYRIAASGPSMMLIVEHKGHCLSGWSRQEFYMLAPDYQTLRV